MLSFNLASKMAQRKLSTIELTVLGIASLRGPCTTYVLMKELGLAESSFYRSRAGTTYSVVKRLLDFGLLEHALGLDKPEKLVQISQEGITALQDWMTPPIMMSDFAHTADLVRTRFYFLGALDPDSRLKFIDHSIERLNALLQRCEELGPLNEEVGDYFGVLANLGAILETRARIQWLKIVRDHVLEPMPPGTDWAKKMRSKLPES